MRLKELRKRAKLSQKELADACGVSLNAISNYESGKNEPTLSVLVSMAKALNVSLDLLCDTNGDIIDLNMLNEDKKRLIIDILNLSPELTGKVQGFVYGLIAK